ncbi:MAG: hypothetical protein M9899_10665 [Bdellovibrionaceae bacterium]|nr:hypothetical protein [Pseudobdellovibrionaceae bacterium]
MKKIIIVLCSIGLTGMASIGCSGNRAASAGGATPEAQPEQTIEVVAEAEAVENKVKPKVDLVFIIDDSGSMHTHRQNVANNLPKLLDQYKDTDLNFLGLTSSWVNTLQYFDTRQASSPYDIGLLVATQLSTGGDAIEKYFSSILGALNNANWSGFIRQDSELVILIVGDAEDQSPIDTGAFLVTLTQYKSLKDIKVNAILPLSKPCAADSGIDFTKILSAVQITGGASYTLCETNWSSFAL